MRGERIFLGLILASICGLLVVHADQPIVENYVGRQIPTAMVARNLDRGSGFWRPTLDTAPFPNRFLVEPPIYAQMVAWVVTAIGFVRERGGWPPGNFVWEVAGRWTSALMTTLGAGAFYQLARRREGPVVGLLALASFGIMPVTLRYGRAFQPDATMLGFVLLGMAGWDAFQETGRARCGWFGGIMLATGLAIKVTAAWILIPYCLLLVRWPVGFRLLGAGLMVVPALLWYGFAWGEIAARPVDDLGARPSLASADNAAIWIRSLSPLGWLRFATWDAVGRNLIVRAFSPVGFVLAGVGFLFVRLRVVVADRFWRGWGVGCALAVLGLGAKWHHGYYWLVVAPLAALGIARSVAAVARIGRWGPVGAAGLASFFLVSCGSQAASTWRTPAEWATIREAGARITASLPAHAALIAAEAVLYYADRPGLRLELDPAAARRASGEWGRPISLESATADPLALVDFYVQQAPGDPGTRFDPRSRRLTPDLTPRYAADVGSAAGDARRSAWREALRRRPGSTVLIDEPTLFLARIEVWPLVEPDRPNSTHPQP